MSVHWSATSLQTEMSPQLLDQSPRNVQTFVHDPQRINPDDFGDPLTFHLEPPASQSFHFQLSEIAWHLIDGWAQYFVQAVTFPRQCILETLVISRLFIWSTSGQNFNLSNTLVHDQITAKQTTCTILVSILAG